MLKAWTEHYSGLWLQMPCILVTLCRDLRRVRDPWKGCPRYGVMYNIQDGAVLLAPLSWHLYPDMVTIGPSVQTSKNIPRGQIDCSWRTNHYRPAEFHAECRWWLGVVIISSSSEILWRFNGTWTLSWYQYSQGILQAIYTCGTGEYPFRMGFI